jgi:hypothetical protein
VVIAADVGDGKVGVSNQVDELGDPARFKEGDVSGGGVGEGCRGGECGEASGQALERTAAGDGVADDGNLGRKVGKGLFWGGDDDDGVAN